MAFTTEQLEALEEAIASGTLEVRTGDKSIRYQSLEEMLKLREVIRTQLKTQEGFVASRAHLSAYVRE